MKKTNTTLLMISAMFAMTLAACNSVTPSSSESVSETSSSESLVSSEEQSSFKVTFTQNYSGSPKPFQVVVDKGGVVEQPEDPTREGYEFTGWHTDKACTTLYDFDTPVVKNIVLFAGWENSVKTVTYNFNYVGAPAMVTQEVPNGSILTPIEDPEREDYEFVGWYLDSVGTDAYDFSLPVTEDLTLYAKWSLSVATVTFDLNYEVDDRISTTKVSIGETLDEPSNPVRTGYDFMGWFKDAEGSDAYDFSTVVSGNFRLYAKWEIQVFTVTFDLNYGDLAPLTQTVEYGQTVSEPDHKRSGYVGIWQLDGEDYDFSTPVTSNFTLVCKWTAESSDSYTYTFHWNYDGAPNGGVYKTQEVKKNYKPAIPAEPDREGFIFSGWYAEPECINKFSFDARANSNKDAYAKWLNMYTFEAEYVDLDGKMGFGFSVNLSGTDLIMKDNGTCEASNGYYVSGLYYEGAFIEFVINSDKAVDDAVVIMRVQAEFDDKTFNPDIFSVTVNDVALDYDEFTIETEEADSRSDDRRPFFDVVLNDTASLKAGSNSIKMTTTNDITHGNTRKGDAPMIDCIYVASDANLTWEPKLDNIKE